MRRYFNSFLITVVVVLIPVHWAVAGDNCPDQLVEVRPESFGWWESRPEFSDVGDVDSLQPALIPEVDDGFRYSILLIFDASRFSIRRLTEYK